MATQTIDPTLSGLQIQGPAGFSGNGYDAINSNLNAQLTSANTSLNASLQNADFSNPATMLQIQQQMALYTTGLGVISAVTKSFEDMLKGITQKM
jgi:type III secretion apparatus needle protein